MLLFYIYSAFKRNRQEYLRMKRDTKQTKWWFISYFFHEQLFNFAANKRDRSLFVSSSPVDCCTSHAMIVFAHPVFLFLIKRIFPPILVPFRKNNLSFVSSSRMMKAIPPFAPYSISYQVFISMVYFSRTNLSSCKRRDMDTLFPFFSRSSEILVICLCETNNRDIKKYTKKIKTRLTFDKVEKDARKNVSCSDTLQL